MSTRSTTHFLGRFGERPTAIIYRHSDGYPEGAGKDLLAFFEKVRSDTMDTRFGDASYLAAKYVVFLAQMFSRKFERTPSGEYEYRDNEPWSLDFLSVGVMDEDPSDIEYRYIVDCSQEVNEGSALRRPRVTVVETGYGSTPDKVLGELDEVVEQQTRRSTRMTHFAGLVLVDKDRFESTSDRMDGRAFNAVAPLVNAYAEDDEWGADGTRYDWYQVGGRFTGLIDGYEPWKDEANYSTCKYCEGTGTTTQAVADQFPAYQEKVGQPCIQCSVGFDGDQKPFPGRSLNWDFVPHGADVIPARDIDIERMRFIPNALVTPDGEWHEGARFGMFAVKLPDEKGNEPKEEAEWSKEFCRLLDDNRDAVAIVVDFHV